MSTVSWTTTLPFFLRCFTSTTLICFEGRILLYQGSSWLRSLPRAGKSSSSERAEVGGGGGGLCLAVQSHSFLVDLGSNSSHFLFLFFFLLSAPEGVFSSSLRLSGALLGVSSGNSSSSMERGASFSISATLPILLLALSCAALMSCVLWISSWQVFLDCCKANSSSSSSVILFLTLFFTDSSSSHAFMQARGLLKPSSSFGFSRPFVSAGLLVSTDFAGWGSSGNFSLLIALFVVKFSIFPSFQLSLSVYSLILDYGGIFTSNVVNNSLRMWLSVLDFSNLNLLLPSKQNSRILKQAKSRATSELCRTSIASSIWLGLPKYTLLVTYSCVATVMPTFSNQLSLSSSLVGTFSTM